MKGFENHLNDLGISRSPLENINTLKSNFTTESDAIESNIQVYSAMLDYLREAVEIFFMIRRQRDRRTLEERKCNELLQNVTKARYNLGELIENIRIFEKNLGKAVNYFIYLNSPYLEAFSFSKSPKKPKLTL